MAARKKSANKKPISSDMSVSSAVKQVESASYLSTLKDSLKMLRFDGAAVERISISPQATGHGMLTVILAGIIGSISFGIQSLGVGEFVLNDLLLGFIAAPFAYFIGIFIWYSIGHFIARKFFGGIATGVQYFRTISNSFILYWASSIIEPLPYIGSIVAPFVELYLLFISIYFIHKVHRISVGKSAVCVLLPILILLIIIVIFFFFLAFFGILTPEKFLPPMPIG